MGFSVDQFSSSSAGQSANSDPAPPFSSERVVSVLMNYWDEAQRMQDHVKGQSDKVIESFNQILPQKVRSSKAVQTKVHLGWTHLAINALEAHLVPLLIDRKSVV